MANEAVLKYLRSTNRPYSTNDIVQNLHKEFAKPAVQRALDALSQEGGPVLEKVYGKQKVYVIRQNMEEKGASEEEIKAMNEDINSFREQLKSVQMQLKETEVRTKMLGNVLTKEQLLEEIRVLQKKSEEMGRLLEGVEMDEEPMTEEQVKEIVEEQRVVAKEYKHRKRLCCDIVDALMEGYPKSKKAFMEDLGLETDEDVGYIAPKNI